MNMEREQGSYPPRLDESHSLQQLKDGNLLFKLRVVSFWLLIARYVFLVVLEVHTIHSIVNQNSPPMPYVVKDE
jgi:hypothetical protein